MTGKRGRTLIAIAVVVVVVLATTSAGVEVACGDAYALYTEYENGARAVHYAQRFDVQPAGYAAGLCSGDASNEQGGQYRAWRLLELANSMLTACEADADPAVATYRRSAELGLAAVHALCVKTTEQGERCIDQLQHMWEALETFTLKWRPNINATWMVDGCDVLGSAGGLESYPGDPLLQAQGYTCAQDFEMLARFYSELDTWPAYAIPTFLCYKRAVMGPDSPYCIDTLLDAMQRLRTRGAHLEQPLCSDCARETMLYLQTAPFVIRLGLNPDLFNITFPCSLAVDAQDGVTKTCIEVIANAMVAAGTLYRCITTLPQYYNATACVTEDIPKFIQYAGCCSRALVFYNLELLNYNVSIVGPIFDGPATEPSCPSLDTAQILVIEFVADGVNTTLVLVDFGTNQTELVARLKAEFSRILGVPEYDIYISIFIPAAPSGKRAASDTAIGFTVSVIPSSSAYTVDKVQEKLAGLSPSALVVPALSAYAVGSSSSSQLIALSVAGSYYNASEPDSPSYSSFFFRGSSRVSAESAVSVSTPSPSPSSSASPSASASSTDAALDSGPLPGAAPWLTLALALALALAP